MNRHNQGKKGFTLLELLISATIFAITVVVGIDLFFSVAKVQRRTAHVQDVQSDSRFILEEMARSVRLGNIDYGYYADPNRDGNTSDQIPFFELRDSLDTNKLLVTRDQENNQYFFERIQEGSLKSGADRYVLKICAVNAEIDLIDKCDGRLTGDYSGWETVTPKNVHLKSFLIFVSPYENPFVVDSAGDKYLSDYQPKVTIVFKTESDDLDLAVKVVSDLQTTISSRAYVR